MSDWFGIAGWSLLAAVVVGAVVAALLARPGGRGASPSLPGHDTPDQPRCYLVFNKELVRKLYTQVPGAGVTLETEDENERNIEGSSSVDPFRGGFNWRGRWSTRRTYPPVSDELAAFAVEERLVAGATRTLDFTAPGGDKAPIDNLVKALETGAARIDLDLPGNVVDDLRRAWQEKSPAVTDKELTSLGLYVRVRAQFDFAGDAADDGDVVLEAPRTGSESVTVRVHCRRAHLTPEFFDRHSATTVTCLATHERTKDDSRTLVLHPIVIYLS